MLTTETPTETPPMSPTDQYLDAWQREKQAHHELSALARRLNQVADAITGKGVPFSVRGYFRPETLAERRNTYHHGPLPVLPTEDELVAVADRLLQAEDDRARLRKEMGDEKARQLDAFQADQPRR